MHQACMCLCRAASAKLHKTGLPQKAAEHRDAAGSKASDLATQARQGGCAMHSACMLVLVSTFSSASCRWCRSQGSAAAACAACRVEVLQSWSMAIKTNVVVTDFCCIPLARVCTDWKCVYIGTIR